MLGYEELVDVVGNKKMVLSEKMLDKLVVTNAVLFNYIDKAEELNYLLGSVDKNIVNECMQLTARLIFDVIKPKLVKHLLLQVLNSNRVQQLTITKVDVPEGTSTFLFSISHFTRACCKPQALLGPLN